MILNLPYQTRPAIFHAQGRPEYSPLWNKIKSLAIGPVAIPHNLAIVTFNNGKSFMGKEPGCFEQSVGPGCTVLGQEIENWQNSMKLALVIEFLRSCNKPYVLSADSSDVVAIHLNIVDKFLSLNCELLFNAESICWPHNSFSAWETNQFKKPFCHLNAGVWIGKRESALTFFQECLKNKPDQESSEQACIKPIYRQWHPKVLIDDTCQLFQTLNRVNSKTLQINAIPL